MSSTSSQRTAIQQFISFTNCSERSAARFLKQNNWNVEIAADAYFNSKHSSSSAAHSSPNASAPTTPALNAIFDQFREAADPPDIIGVNGCMAYLQSINVGLEEPTVIVIAELLKAPTMGEFAREGFVDGWKALHVDSLDKMRAVVPSLKTQFATDEAVFKKIYMFTFGFARTGNQKGLTLDVAAAYWKLLLADRFSTHIDAWIEFLETEWKKAINKDIWNCMYEFVQLARNDPALKGYDVDGAWPSILDDFVVFWRKKTGEEEL